MWSQNSACSAKLRACGTAFVLLALASCSQGPNLVGIGEPLADVPTNSVPATHRVFIATTRAPSEEPGVFFSGARSNQINFGSVDVSIPPNHRPGSLELPRNSSPDPAKHFVLHSPARIADENDFLQKINAAAAAKPRGSRSALVFVHGYNTNTTEAIARFGQLVEDTGFEGVPILFTWPSTRRTIDYVADINSAAYSRDALAQTAFLLSRSNIDSFDMISHSMGNFLMMEAIRTVSLSGNSSGLTPLNNVVLAAPDIDLQLFVKQLSAVPTEQKRKLVVLISRDDNALRASQRVAGGYPRLGSTDPETVSQLGIRVIDLTEIDDPSSINHSKFADSPEIVQLLGERLAQSDTLSTQTGVTGIAIQKAGDVVSVFSPP